MTLATEQPAAIDEGDAEALFKEAKQRERRRRLIVLGAILLVVFGAGAGIASLTSNKTHKVTNPNVTVGQAPKIRSIEASGPIVTPVQPAALAVGPNGGLYVADTGRDQVLERFADGKFRVLAGTGKVGFSGDGGPAIDAELNLGAPYESSGLAVARNGSLYIADTQNNRVRVVTPNGTINTVLGNGQPVRQSDLPLSSPVHGTRRDFSPTPAQSLALGAPSGLAFAANGDLYVAGSNVAKLSPSGVASWVAGGIPASPKGSSLIESQFYGSTSLALDARGDVFVTNPNTFGVAEIKVDGQLVGYGRNFGFGLVANGTLASTPSGSIVEGGLSGLFQINETGQVTPLHLNLDAALGPYPATPRFEQHFVPNGIAIDRDGTIYVDAKQVSQWSSVSAIVAVSPKDHVVRLRKS